MLEVQDGAVHSTVISSFDLLTLEILMNFFSQVPMNVVGVVQVTSRHALPLGCTFLAEQRASLLCGEQNVERDPFPSKTAIV